MFFFALKLQRAFFPYNWFVWCKKQHLELVVKKFSLKTKALHETTFNNITKVLVFFPKLLVEIRQARKKTNEKKVCWTKIGKRNQAVKHFLSLAPIVVAICDQVDNNEN